MMETHPNLSAWLDDELPVNEATAVARHVESCEVCSRECTLIREASTGLQQYCDATLTAHLAKPKATRWVPALAAFAALLAIAIFLALPRKRSVAPTQIPAPVASAAPAPVQSLQPQSPVVHKHVHRNRTVSVPQQPAVSWPATDTAVEIAIPADAVFAPGALPEGTRLLGEMRFAPDGTLREIRLRQ
jgi:anti-sigma factor RsiW